MLTYRQNNPGQPVTGSDLYMFTDFEEMNKVACRLIIKQALASVRDKDFFTLVLSGGRTPQRLYELLSFDGKDLSMPWDKTHVFWGDERLVPMDSEHSNFRLARDTLLSRIKIPEINVHPMRVDQDSSEENARLSEQDLRDFFGGHVFSARSRKQKARFPGPDLVLLGMGPDGHTASLFPGSPVLKETSRMIAAVEPGPDISPAVPRLTMTLPFLNAARMVIFLVSGQNKHLALKKIFEPGSKDPLPAGLIQPKGRLRWLVHPPLVDMDGSFSVSPGAFS